MNYVICRFIYVIIGRLGYHFNACELMQLRFCLLTQGCSINFRMLEVFVLNLKCYAIVIRFS